ncbi:hypothetical protein Tco_1445155, partial [Tanacetum coccineum]
AEELQNQMEQDKGVETRTNDTLYIEKTKLVTTF